MTRNRIAALIAAAPLLMGLAACGTGAEAVTTAPADSTTISAPVVDEPLPSTVVIPSSTPTTDPTVAPVPVVTPAPVRVHHPKSSTTASSSDTVAPVTTPDSPVQSLKPHMSGPADGFLPPSSDGVVTGHVGTPES